MKTFKNSVSGWGLPAGTVMKCVETVSHRHFKVGNTYTILKARDGALEISYDGGSSMSCPGSKFVEDVQTIAKLAITGDIVLVPADLEYRHSRVFQVIVDAEGNKYLSQIRRGCVYMRGFNSESIKDRSDVRMFRPVEFNTQYAEYLARETPTNVEDHPHFTEVKVAVTETPEQIEIKAIRTAIEAQTARLAALEGQA